MEIDQILTQRWKDAQNEPSPYERYKQKLLDAFPEEIPSGELFCPEIHEEPDATDYRNCINIFKGKKWFEVDFDAFYKNYTQHRWLTNLGIIYYLPAFLLYFYDLRHLDLEYYLYLRCDLEDGLLIPYSGYLHDFTPFESLTQEQSKLVALFLANAANLYPSDYREARQAQRALKNYWGKFLLMD